MAAGTGNIYQKKRPSAGTNSDPAVGGIVVTSSSGVTSYNSTVPALVTNQTAKISVSGQAPVLICIQPDNSGTNTGRFSAPADQGLNLTLKRDGTAIALTILRGTGQTGTTEIPSVWTHWDYDVVTGSPAQYTWTLYANWTNAAAASPNVDYVRMIVGEVGFNF